MSCTPWCSHFKCHKTYLSDRHFLTVIQCGSGLSNLICFVQSLFYLYLILFLNILTEIELNYFFPSFISSSPSGYPKVESSHTPLSLITLYLRLYLLPIYKWMCIWMSIEISTIPILCIELFLGKTVLQQTSWYSGLYNLTALSSAMFPEP